MCEFLKKDSPQKSGKSETAILKIYDSADLKSANFASQLITAGKKADSEVKQFLECQKTQRLLKCPVSQTGTEAAPMGISLMLREFLRGAS